MRGFSPFSCLARLLNNSLQLEYIPTSPFRATRSTVSSASSNCSCPQGPSLFRVLSHHSPWQGLLVLTQFKAFPELWQHANRACLLSSPGTVYEMYRQKPVEGRQAPSTGQDHGRLSRGGEAFEPALQEMIMWEGHVSYKEQSWKRHEGRNCLECAEDLGEFALMVRVKERRHEARRSCAICLCPCQAPRTGNEYVASSDSRLHQRIAF